MEHIYLSWSSGTNADDKEESTQDSGAMDDFKETCRYKSIYTYKLRDMVACTKPVKTQSDQILAWNRELGTQSDL